MKKEDKSLVIQKIKDTLAQYSAFYLVETAGLDAEKTSAFRRACFGADVKLMVVKNALLHKALEQMEGDYSELYPTLHGATSLICTNVGNAPAKLIKDFVKKGDTLPNKFSIVSAYTSSISIVNSSASLADECIVCPSCHKNSLDLKKGLVSFSHLKTLHH